jgi:hypothetical protein
MYEIFLPHPNPPLVKERELDFLVSLYYPGMLVKGGNWIF